MIEKKEPERLCMACREKKLKKDLIRIVKEKSGNIRVDDLKKFMGRGAYLCFNERCLKTLKKKKGLERNFKCKVEEKVYLDLECKINEFLKD